MTGYEMEEYIRDGKPFYVFGDVMEYNSSKGDKGSPYSFGEIGITTSGFGASMDWR